MGNVREKDLYIGLFLTTCFRHVHSRNLQSET